MARKIEFHAVEFFRGVRDQQAALLKGRSKAEIIAFFSTFGKKAHSLTRRSAGRAKSVARRSTWACAPGMARSFVGESAVAKFSRTHANWASREPSREAPSYPDMDQRPSCFRRRT